jgi:hypothetical protein
MKETSRLKKGDQVRIRALGMKQWSRATAVLASDTNPSSVMLALADGEGLRVARGFYLNFVPLTIDYATETVTGLLGGEFEIEVAG